METPLGTYGSESTLVTLVLIHFKHAETLKPLHIAFIGTKKEAYCHYYSFAVSFLSFLWWYGNKGWDKNVQVVMFFIRLISVLTEKGTYLYMKCTEGKPRPGLISHIQKCFWHFHQRHQIQYFRRNINLILSKSQIHLDKGFKSK